jgi:hypothetical protein
MKLTVKYFFFTVVLLLGGGGSALIWMDKYSSLWRRQVNRVLWKCNITFICMLMVNGFFFIAVPAISHKHAPQGTVLLEGTTDQSA